MVETYQVPPWLLDDPTCPKRFALAGFVANQMISEEEMTRRREDVIMKLQSLGGEYVAGDEWEDRVTHVIWQPEVEKEGGLPEKVMAAIAAGRIVVTKKYLERSVRAGKFLESLQTFLAPKDAVAASRKNYHQAEQAGRRESGGMFQGIRALLLMKQSTKKEAFRRIIVAGGGTADISSLRKVVNVNFNLTPYSHIFLDLQQRNEKRMEGLMENPSVVSIKCLNYKFLFRSLKAGELLSDESFDMKSLSGPGQRSNKRPGGDGETNRSKKIRHDVIDLTDVDEDDEDIAIVEECYGIPSGRVTQTQTRTHVPTIVLDDELTLIDEEEDIEVLEERLARTRQSEGSGRQYVERKKARGRVSHQTVVTIEEEDIQSVVEERERSLTPPIMEVEQEEDQNATESEPEVEENHEEEKRVNDTESIQLEEDQGVNDAESHQEELNIPTVPSMTKEVPVVLEPPEVSETETVELPTNTVLSVGSEVVEEQVKLSGDQSTSAGKTVRAKYSPKEDSEAAPLSEDVEESSPVLNRILSTLNKRFKYTDERMAIGNINSRTARYDKHGEGGKPSPRTFLKGGIESNFRTECEREMNLSSGMLRLSLDNSHVSLPSAYILHVVVVQVLLEGTDHILRVQAEEYLEKFLFLHLSRSKREDWLTLVLSACRTLDDHRAYRGFDLTNSRDLQSCWLFFSEVVNRILSSSNSELFLVVFVKILHKDFEFWWKHSRSKGDFPLLFYLLGGSESNILKRMEGSVLKLYSASLKESSMLTSARKLVSMSALLISHIDSYYSQHSLSSGNKVLLASELASIIEKAELTSRGLYTELILLQPPWLSAEVSQTLLRSQHPLQPTHSLSTLTSQSRRSDVAQDSRLQLLIEVSCQKVCSYQQTHNIFRTAWHFVRKVERPFTTFKHMMKLEEEERKVNKLVKYEGIGVKLSSVVENINTVRNYASHTSEDLVGPLSFLFFRMDLLHRF